MALPYEIVGGEMRRPAGFEGVREAHLFDGQTDYYTREVSPELSEVRSFAVPDGVTAIGAELFAHCENLSAVTIPYGVTLIGRGAFSGCRALASVTVPESVTFIGEDAFAGCRALTSVALPGSVTTMGERAFAGCRALTDITVPDGAVSVGKKAFAGCKGLADADGMVIVRGVLYDYFGSGGKVVIPKCVTAIGEGAFIDCDSLTDITIPESVTSVGTGAFEGCRNLTSVSICGGGMSIGEFAFGRCSRLKSVTISGRVTSVGDRAFTHCSSLTAFSVPDGVRSIGKGVFWGCGNLKSVTVPSSVAAVDALAFMNCGKLASIHIADLYLIDEGHRPACVVGFAEDRRGCTDANGKKYLEYMRSHVEALLDLALHRPALFHLLTRENVIGESLLNEKMDRILRSGNAEIIAMALEYKNRLAAEAKHDPLEEFTL